MTDNHVKILGVKMVSINFVMFAFRELFFRHDSPKNVAGIDAFQ